MRVAATKIRHPRAGRASIAILVVCAAASALACAVLHAEEESQQLQLSAEPLSAIQSAAQSYIAAQFPAGASIASISAAPLDPRLRLARCTGALLASLAPGA